MNNVNARVCAIFVLTAAAALSACSVSQATKDAVARSETAVGQAQQTLGNSEAGALELQTARTQIEQAKKAVKDGEEDQAKWLAHVATLNAELATAKSRTATVQKVANDVQASIQTLRQEAERPTH